MSYCTLMEDQTIFKSLYKKQATPKKTLMATLQRITL